MTNRLNRSADSRDQALPDATEQPGEPSWFFQRANSQPADLLAERYRQGGRPERRALASAPSRAELPSGFGPRGYLATERQPPRQFLEREEAPVRRPSRQPAPKSNAKGLVLTYAAAALLAAGAGGTVGYVSSQTEDLMSSAEALLTRGSAPVRETKSEAVMPEAARPVAAATTSVVSKKPVATATLDVADARGGANAPIPLILSAEPAVGGEDLLLKISGLPPAAYLTAGVREQDDAWSLSPSDLANLKLVVPELPEKRIDLAVAAFEKRSGALAAPIKSLSVTLTDPVIEPAAAPPPTHGKPAATLTGTETRLAAIPEPSHTDVTSLAARHAAEALARTGDGLLASGDIAAARDAYRKTWEAGLADGALGLARSYDPLVLAGLKLKTADADAATALTWYDRAADKGSEEAKAAILRLRMKP